MFCSSTKRLIQVVLFQYLPARLTG